MSNPIWPMLAAERSALADYLATLAPADWERPTPCAGWSVKDQVAHVVAGAETTPVRFLPSLAVSGFSFDKLGARGIRQRAHLSLAELIRQLQARVSAKTLPGAAYLGEVVVHGEDIRNAVGAPAGEHPVAHLIAVADAYSTSGGPVGGKKRIAGLTLTATDAAWTTGSGPEIKGPLVLLVMAICGREFALDGLTGPGVDRLASRRSHTAA